MKYLRDHSSGLLFFLYVCITINYSDKKIEGFSLDGSNLSKKEVLDE